MEHYTWWDQVPESLKTKTQLGEQGLKPGGPVRAQIEYGRGRRHRCYDLYAVAEAKQKVATAGQLAALEQARIAQRTCKECGKVVERPGQLSPRGRCPDCLAAYHRRKRAKEIDQQILWARGILATEGALILDTETTDLHGRLVEIGIVDLQGKVILDTLVNPEAPYEFEAEHIHGISRRMCWGAPTFADIEPELRKLLHGRTVVVYNSAYDEGVIRGELYTMGEPTGEARWWLEMWRRESVAAWDGTLVTRTRYEDNGLREAEYLAQDHAAWWIGRVNWQCAMQAWSIYVGDPYWRGGYSSQPLGGSHRAIGDTRACLDVVRRLASMPLSIEEPKK